MSRSGIRVGVVVGMAIGALLLASPATGGPFAVWLPSVDFALGVGLVTIAFLEGARGARRWFVREASLAETGGAILAVLGLFVAGASLISTPHRVGFDWVAFGGIFAATGGVHLQQRARAEHRAPD